LPEKTQADTMIRNQPFLGGIMLKLIAVLFLIPFASSAANWSNCIPSSVAEAIRHEFQKADTNNSTGPDYLLPSGQVFSSNGTLCQDGKAFSPVEWQKVTKEINPTDAGSIKSFKSISTVSEFENFLASMQVKVQNQKELAAKVDAYLKSESQNPTIIVGSSKTDAVIVLGSAEKNQRLATVMQIRMTTPKRGTIDSDDPTNQ
jgi:hypothetical protein